MRSTPKLAPPGAGLPAFELFIARSLMAWRRWRGDRESFTARFKTEREKIAELLRDCDGQTGARRILIARPRGLEDSSRDWSLWMTLDHLRIVNGAIVGVLGALGRGEVPEGQASTAAVKPSPDADASARSAYEASCDTLLSTAAGIAELKTAARYRHPWFGPMDAAGWYALAGTHLGVHRVQMEKILAGLKKSE